MPGGDHSHGILVELLNPDGSVHSPTTTLRDFLYSLVITGVPGGGTETTTVFSVARGNLIDGQTSFTIPGGYTPNQADVYLNGIRLAPADDVVVTSGSVVVLQAPATIADVLIVTSR